MPIYKTGQQKDGRAQYKVCVNYTDVHGKYRQKSKRVYGLTEAKIAELQLMSEVSESPKDSNITVQELYNEYMSVKKNEVRLSTLKKSEEYLKHHILPTTENIKLDKLNSKVLQTWKQSIYDKNLALKTMQNAYKEFHTMLNYAVKMDYLNKNPLNAVGNFKEVYFDAPAKDKLHYYTAEEFKKYIAEAAANCTNIQEYGYYVFFNIAFYTGMRKGEINALKWSDIEKDLIHVRRSISQKLGCGDFETPPKNKSSYRELQMPLPLIKILNEHKKRQKAMPGFNEEYRVCGGIAPLRDSNIEKRNSTFAKAAELPHIRIHDFRHTHASLLINEGINIQEIARRLGHSNVEITWQTYAHLYPREEERAVKILNELNF